MTEHHRTIDDLLYADGGALNVGFDTATKINLIA